MGDNNLLTNKSSSFAGSVPARVLKSLWDPGIRGLASCQVDAGRLGFASGASQGPGGNSSFVCALIGARGSVSGRASCN